MTNWWTDPKPATDPKLLVAEQWTAELLTCSQAAINADPHWRINLRALLAKIERGELPDRSHERLREADHRKRVAEILADCL